MSHQAWSKNGDTKAPNIMKLIKWVKTFWSFGVFLFSLSHPLPSSRAFNHTTYWVASEVVTQPQLENRVQVVVKMIELAERCEQINNFQTLMEILVGLRYVHVDEKC